MTEAAEIAVVDRSTGRELFGYVTLTPEDAADLARVLAALRRPGGISIADLPEPARLDRLAEQLA